MVLALIVTMIVVTLSIAVVNQSIHASNSSAFDRRRTIAVSAAEAGVDDYYHYLGDLYSAGTLSLSAVNCTRTGSVTSGPNQATWNASLTFYTQSGSTYTATTCPPPTGIVPAAAKISSTGLSPSTILLRKMESFVRLTPQYGGFNQALLAMTTTSVTNKVTLNGLEGDDADVILNCPTPPCTLSLTNNQSISGNVYVSGAVSMTNSVDVGGDVWSSGNITMTTGATINGDAKSSQGSISVTNPASIAGNALAAGTVASTAQVGGTSSPNAVLDDPLTWSLPQVTFDATQQAAWQDQGFQIMTFTACTGVGGALPWITTVLPTLGSVPNTYGTKDYVVYINSASPCDLSFSNNTTINLPGSLGIVTSGSITTSGQVTFQAMNANATRLAAIGADAQLFLIDVYRSGLVCGGTSSPFSPGPYDITTSNNTNFLNVSSSPILAVSMYSPCAVHLSNQNSFNGQVLAKTLDIRNQVTINYQPVLIPGVARVTGFKQDPVYKREVG
jgi:Tfp pilus assembly protein PilX